MLEIVIIIGITMGLVEAIKKKTTFPKKLLFVPVLIIAAGLNALNAQFLNGVEITEAISEGIQYGAIASGIYGLGKKALEKDE